MDNNKYSLSTDEKDKNIDIDVEDKELKDIVVDSEVNIKTQTILLAKTIIYFWVNETKFIKIAKNTNYEICTDWLNWCSTSIIIIKNSIDELFVISSHFPPIEFMRKKQLINIEISLLSNINHIWIIEKIFIFSITDISKKNEDYQKVEDLINKLTWINTKSMVSKYNSSDIKRANKEHLGKLNINVKKDLEIIFSHEWKNYSERF